jgi:hypothetical protein
MSADPLPAVERRLLAEIGEALQAATADLRAAGAALATVDTAYAAAITRLDVVDARTRALLALLDTATHPEGDPR